MCILFQFPVYEGQHQGQSFSPTDDRPHVCPWDGCGQRFKTTTHVKQHLYKHTGEKPFVCSFCSYRSSWKGNLVAHVKKVHIVNTGEILTKDP